MKLCRCGVSFLLFLTLLPCLGRAVESAATKAYSPFDEPRPKIPQEMLDDKRLDVKVKVFVKSKNMKQLFADLSATTGVKVTAARDLWGERPIIYFHSRPLRDVLTEVSGLYGYHWLISGKPGARQYELFEDIRHAKRRSEIAEEIKTQQNDLLLDIARKCMEDDATIDRLADAGDKRYGSMFAGTLKETSRMFSRFGPDFLKGILANRGVDCRVSDLSPEWQQAVVDWRNASYQRIKSEFEAQGEAPPPNLRLYTLADMGPSSFKVASASVSPWMPSFAIEVMTPQPDGSASGSVFRWPFRRLSEDGARTVAGWPVARKVLSDAPLPDEPKITADKRRLIGTWGFSQVLLLGDVLEAIAAQSGMDVIADYHLRSETLLPFKAVPLRKTVENVCDTFLCACQAEKKTLRFRCNRWFAEPLMEEPPGEVVERLWRAVEEKGRLDIHDLVGLAILSDKQLAWPGLKAMPGGHEVGSRGSTLRLWASLSADDESQARTDAGLPVSRLSSEQRGKLDSWVTAMKIEASADAVDRSAIKMRAGSVDEGWSEPGTLERLILSLPDRKDKDIYLIFPPPLKADDRKALAVLRKADAEADEIKVLGR